jgi:Holliday junction DNA helicase RuvA
VIERLTGKVLVKEVDGAVLALAGLGLRLEMSATSLRDLPAVGQDASLFTHLYVREDALQLFGFSTEDERALFLMLIGVSKIGPRLALAALSARRPAEVRRAIALGETAAFQAVPGIGKKTAERLILELREKVGELIVPPGGTGPAAASPADGNLALARAALQELGLSASEADHLVRTLDPAEPVSELVRRALASRR